MTITTYPADAIAGAPVYSGRKLRQASVSPFVAPGSTTRPLGARSGIRPGTPDSVFSISGTTWSVGQHVGIIDTATASESGAYGYANDAAVTGSITAASASIIRWDGVFAQLTDPAETPGSGTPRVDFVYVAGTAASTMPATPTRSFPLMRIVVPVNGTGSATVVPVAPFYSSPGAPLWVRAAAELSSWSPVDGSSALDLSTMITHVRRGGVWKGGTVTLTTDSVYDKHVTPYNAVAFCDDGEVYLEGLIRNAAVFGANAGTRYVFGSIPSQFAPARTLRFSTVSVLGFAIIEVTTTGELAYWISSSVANVPAGSWNLSLSGLRWKVQ